MKKFSCKTLSQVNVNINITALQSVIKSSKKKLVYVLLTAAFGVSTEFLVREFRHLSFSFSHWQQKPHWENKPGFEMHVCSVCECTRWSNGGSLVGFLLPSVCVLSPRRRCSDGSPPFSTPPTPYLTHEHTQSSFQTVQSGKQGRGRGGGGGGPN